MGIKAKSKEDRLVEFVKEFDKMSVWFALSSGLPFNSVAETAYGNAIEARNDIGDLVPKPEWDEDPLIATPTTDPTAQPEFKFPRNS